jgi:hypothetical protein
MEQGKSTPRRWDVQQREETTREVLELDRLAWNLPPAVKRPSPPQAPSSVKSEREAHESEPEAA